MNTQGEVNSSNQNQQAHDYRDSNVESERWEWIKVAAYYNAERRAFEGSYQLDDWLQAERAIDSMNAGSQSADGGA